MLSVTPHACRTLPCSAQIFGCVLAGVSGWALANESALAQLIPRGGLFMVLGCAFVLAIVACLGVYGALDEHKVSEGVGGWGEGKGVSQRAVC